MSNYYLFLLSAVLLNITPGPDMFYVMSRTISHGKKLGFFTVLGVCSGALIHVVLISLGVTAIVMRYPNIFNIIKILGALYLIYIGVQSILQARKSDFVVMDKKTIQLEYSYFQAYKQGVLVDLFNPKVAIFFLSFLPIFVVENSISKSTQLFLLGCTVIFIAFVIESMIVFFLDFFKEVIRKGSKNASIFDNITGLILIFIGISVFLS